MQQNPALSENRFNPMTIKDRSNGLNHINELRNKIFGETDKELKDYINSANDRFSDDAESSKRFLSMIYWWARIEPNRHSCKYEELTKKEIKAIVRAMIDIKSNAANLPKRFPSVIN